MWKPRLFGAAPATPTLPAGVRIYAIGDIHGRADLLDQVFSRIDADLARYPIAHPLQIFLGDYIDRGSHSADVVTKLIDRARHHKVVCLKGNHEIYVLEFLRNPPILRSWGQYGGLSTLLSYGLAPSFSPTPEEEDELARELARVLPKSHSHFFSSLPASFACGDYFFAHAGIRPGAPLARQSEEDLLWIREEFLSCEESFEKVIVHGHTPVMEPEVRRNRINVDTGAYATGRLSCVRLEGDQISFI